MKQIKKQVLLVLCVVACLFSLTACGKTTDAGSGIDPMTEESLKQQTVTLLEQMVSIPADQMTTIVEQNRKAGLETYVGLEDDLGAYVSSGEGTVKEIDDGYEVTVDTVFEKRACAFSITITEDMTSITGMSFAPVYSLGENMEKAALNTLMGMGTVFIVLIFISLLISCFKYISVFENKKKAAAPAAPAAPAPAAPAPVALTTAAPAGTDDAEMERLAVMTAIIEHRRRTASSDSLVVRPIKRSAGNRWKRS